MRTLALLLLDGIGVLPNATDKRPHTSVNSEKINVTLPKSLIDRIDRCVATHPEFKTRSGFLAQVALERISKSA